LRSSDLAIRRLAPEDAPVYRTLRLRALLEHPDAFTSSHAEDSKIPLATTERRLAPDSPDWVYGGFVAGELAGIVGLVRERRAKNRHKASVFGMYVAPEHGRQGIGAALLRHVIETARLEGIEQLVLTVTDNNVPARTLYERSGFRSFGVEPRAIRVNDGVNDVYCDKNHMILILSLP
jgi:ribosomal protein S18 acetylase RimI-like enzyme